MIVTTVLGALTISDGQPAAAGPLRQGGQSSFRFAKIGTVSRRLASRRRACRTNETARPAATAPEAAPAQSDPFAWTLLFDGKTLGQWKVPVYGGDGEVRVRDGAIELGMGVDLTGITWTGELPRTNYELTLEGMRLDGNDFFATTTFPVGDRCCSLVVGGWGGTVVGISNVDFYDAYNNNTAKFRSFENKRWYRIRIQVSDARIEAWINDEQLVDLPRGEHKFDVRMEVELSKPLGVTSWCTKSAVRDLRLRRLTPEEVAAAAEVRESD
ncbi:MAG: DUF1080 domain-containing protein [Pirellulales bacterium]|nr:DUF1080 domain-containing protein [Pirellulales bacterium]